MRIYFQILHSYIGNKFVKFVFKLGVVKHKNNMFYKAKTVKIQNYKNFKILYFNKKWSKLNTIIFHMRFTLSNEA